MSKEQFFSFKNQVYLEDGKVYKIHENNECAKKEAEVLKRLYGLGVSVPKIYSLEDSVICMEYTEGTLLIDEFLRLSESKDNKGLETLADKIFVWFQSFYNIYEGRVKGDVNARNFIINNNKNIIGLDFEDIKEGEAEEDLGKMLAFFITYEPVGDINRKAFLKRLYKIFSAGFDLKKDEIIREFELEILAMNNRRENCNFSFEEFSNIIFM